MKIRRHGILALTLLAACSTTIAEAQTLPTTYVAEYSASYKGRDVGTSIFSLRAGDMPNQMTYSSEARIKGLLRILSPNLIVDRSEFKLDGSRIVPTSFLHEDGTRSGDDNHTITFDWAAGKARIDGEDGRLEIDISNGTLDRASLQVALMLDLSRGVQPRRYDVVDEDSLKTYEYEYRGTRTVTTGIGAIETVTYTQTREGSSRSMTIDFAPSLGYVPVRIEQVRDGESQSEFLLQSIDTHP